MSWFKDDIAAKERDQALLEEVKARLGSPHAEFSPEGRSTVNAALPVGTTAPPELPPDLLRGTGVT